MAMWVVMAIVVAVGVPFVLLWWRVADRWADGEHKRFKQERDDREKIVVKQPSSLR